jgi:hypothetical protein
MFANNGWFEYENLIMFVTAVWLFVIKPANDTFVCDLLNGSYAIT